jgi:hypothetical protein
MQIIKFLPLFFVVVFSTCKSPPAFVSFFVEDGVIQHFLSPTHWTAKNSKVKLDITYRTGVDWPATVNISFYGKKTTPRNVNSVFLYGTEECPLEYISVILVDPDQNELRISFNADRDKLINLLKAELITLTATVDGTRYVYTPKKKFYKNKDKFLIAITIS